MEEDEEHCGNCAKEMIGKNGGEFRYREKMFVLDHFKGQRGCSDSPVDIMKRRTNTQRGKKMKNAC